MVPDPAPDRRQCGPSAGIVARLHEIESELVEDAAKCVAAWRRRRRQADRPAREVLEEADALCGLGERIVRVRKTRERHRELPDAGEGAA